MSKLLVNLFYMDVVYFEEMHTKYAIYALQTLRVCISIFLRARSMKGYPN